MFKRIAVVAAFIIATPAAAQTINCTTMGNQTNCTQRDTGNGEVERAQADLVESTRWKPIVAPAPRQPQNVPQPTGDGTTSETRRAAAYAQVGKLISDGDCPAAQRLAKFYGKWDLIADTAEACKQ